MLKPNINTGTLPVNFALTIALPSVDGVAIVTGHAALAVRPGCQVPTVLAHAAIHTLAVTITLTHCQDTHTKHRVRDTGRRCTYLKLL